MKTKFKSVRPVNVHTERGTDFIQIEGIVKEVKGNKVFLKGIMYDFWISKNDFELFNICKA